MRKPSRRELIVAMISAASLVWLVVRCGAPIGQVLSTATRTAEVWLPAAVAAAGVVTLVVWWWPRHSRPWLKPLPAWMTVVVGLVAIAGGAVALTALLGKANRFTGADQANLRIDAIRTALTVTAGASEDSVEPDRSSIRNERTP